MKELKCSECDKLIAKIIEGEIKKNVNILCLDCAHRLKLRQLDFNIGGYSNERIAV